MKKNAIAYYIIASALIWAAVIIGCSLKLKGTECYDTISNILVGGAGVHLVLIWGPMASMFRKTAKE